MNWKSPHFAAQLQMAQHLRWMVDAFTCRDGITQVRGWALSPFHPAEDIRFLANGESVVAPATLDPDPELHARMFPDLPEAPWRFTLRYAAPANAQFHSLAFLPSGKVDSPDIPLGAWHLLDTAAEDDPFPGGANIFRVIADQGVDTFRLGGATVAHRIAAWLKQALGKDLSEVGAVLDWGCGCGRVTRYLRKLGCHDLSGVDIDETNVAWCRANLPWLPVRLAGLAPPLPYADASFDMVIGISIFTHLREASQFAWLAELARVLRPGGIALVTVMREGQLALQGASPDRIAEVAECGFAVTDDNDQLRFGNDDENYYANVYHTAAYLMANWQRHFRIREIVPFLGAHQDAVILQKI